MCTLEYVLFKNWLACSKYEITAFTLCCALCTMAKWATREKYCKHDKYGKVNCVAKRYTENSRVMPRSQSWEHFANIMFSMSFELSPCFSFWQATLYHTVHQSRSFSLVLEKGMFCLIQGLCVWQDYCEALDVTSLLFQKPVQFPLNH